MSRSYHSATSSKATCALPFTTRARPQTRSAVMGLRLCGMALEPFWPFANGSSASMTSDCWQQAHLHGDGLQRGGRHGQAGHDLRVAVARKHLRGQRVGHKAQALAHVLLHERVDARVRAHRARDGARGGHLAGLLHARLGALEGPGPAAELHAERHGFRVDAVRAADAERVLELEGAALARLAQLLDVFQDEVDGLRDLVGERGVAQVGRRHAVMYPTARGLGALRHVGVDVLGHVRGEGDDVVVRHLLYLVYALHGEVRVRADPRGLLLRDAGLPSSAWASQASTSISFQISNLFCSFPDGAHRRTRVAVDHALTPSLAARFPCRRALPFSDVVKHTAPQVAHAIFHGKRRERPEAAPRCGTPGHVWTCPILRHGAATSGHVRTRPILRHAAFTARRPMPPAPFPDRL